ncbi:hypothetical protein RIVM261_016900 [Rivularia sp. IAM M-261]|nr:hypothetical protein RIVM261_016900 [Rivularia sp. IAM M-261]
MKKLVNPQVAVREEDLNLLSRLKGFSNRKLKTVKSIAIAMGCVTASVVVSVPRAQADIGLLRAREGLAGAVSAPQNPLSNRVFNRNSGRQGTEISGESQSGKPKGTVGGPVKQAVTPEARNTQQEGAEKYGKLILRNDTEIGGLIFLHAPGSQRFSRYAYVPACSAREMSAEYTNGWRVSADTVHLHKVVVGKKGVMEVRRSTFTQHPNVTDCDQVLREKAHRAVASISPNQDARAIPRTPLVQEVALSSSLETEGEKAIKAAKNIYQKVKVPGVVASKLVNGQEALSKVNVLLDNYILNFLQSTNRTPNVQDLKEMRLVAQYLKGDGTNLLEAAKRLEQYINDCKKVFATKPEAQRFLSTVQQLQWTAQNIETLNRQSRDELAALVGQVGGTGAGNKTLLDLNSKIIPGQPPTFSGLGIYCLTNPRLTPRNILTEI